MDCHLRPARGLWLLVWAMVSGCAAHGRPASNPFVKPGKPLLEIGEPTKVPKVAKAPKGAGHAPPAVHSSSSILPTIESTDRPLSAALLRVAIDGTAGAHRAAAERYRALGILDMAYDHYERAARIDRTDSAAYEGLARIWRDWGFPQLGMADASRAVFYAPSSAPAHNTLGTLLAALGQSASARREYERVVQLDPDAAYAWNNLCQLSYHGGEFGRAAEECREALSMDPSLATAQGTLRAIERRDQRDRVP